MLLVLRFLVEVVFYLPEPLLTFDGATEPIQGPLLGILLEDQQNQDYQVTIQVVEVSMTLLRAVVDSYPEKVESDIVKQVHKFRVISFFVEGFPHIEDKLRRIDQSDAKKSDHELEQPDVLSNLDLIVVDFDLVFVPPLLALLDCKVASVFVVVYIDIP